MELTYDAIVEFMEEYFPVYSEYGQDPATAHRMHDYYAPDFVFTGYVGRPEPVVYPSAEDFLEFDVSHPSSHERLTPEDMAIDERRKIVWVLIKFEFIEKKTGQVLVEERGVSRYQLVLDENDTIKIKSLLFFPQRLVPGMLSGTDVFLRDLSVPETGDRQAAWPGAHVGPGRISAAKRADQKRTFYLRLRVGSKRVCREALVCPRTPCFGLAPAICRPGTSGCLRPWARTS